MSGRCQDRGRAPWLHIGRRAEEDGWIVRTSRLLKLTVATTDTALLCAVTRRPVAGTARDERGALKHRASWCSVTYPRVLRMNLGNYRRSRSGLRLEYPDAVAPCVRGHAVHGSTSWNCAVLTPFCGLVRSWSPIEPQRSPSVVDVSDAHVVYGTSQAQTASRSAAVVCFKFSPAP